MENMAGTLHGALSHLYWERGGNRLNEQRTCMTPLINLTGILSISMGTSHCQKIYHTPAGIQKSTGSHCP